MTKRKSEAGKQIVAPKKEKIDLGGLPRFFAEARKNNSKKYFNQEKLGEVVGCTKMTLISFEKNGTPISSKFIFKMCKVLGIQITFSYVTKQGDIKTYIVE